MHFRWRKQQRQREQQRGVEPSGQSAQRFYEKDAQSPPRELHVPGNRVELEVSECRIELDVAPGRMASSAQRHELKGTDASVEKE